MAERTYRRRVEDLPPTPLHTEAALRVGLTLRAAGYDVEPLPRRQGADLGAARRGTIWVTFHIDIDRKQPLWLHVGATVFGGARQDCPIRFPYHDPAAYLDGRLEAYVRERLSVACRRGLEHDPDHCADCPRGADHRRGRFDP